MTTTKNKTAWRIPGDDKKFIDMKENQDKVTAKVKELAETVTAANGSVLVIGLIEGGTKAV